MAYKPTVLLLLAALLMTSVLGSRYYTAQEANAELFKEFKDEIKSLRTLWPGNDYCQYDGVTCDANGDVHINLRGRGLYGEMPEVDDDWGKYTSVVSIDLSDNVGLSDDLEEDWKHLTQLRVLNLSYTSFDDDIPDDWDEMSGLEELYLHNTAVCKSLPKWNGYKMRNLRILNLSNNNMYGSLRSEWGSFANLQTVDLSGNNFCGCVPSSWSSNSVLTNAVSGMSVASSSCFTDRCSQKSYCPKTPNFGGNGNGNNNNGGNNNGGNGNGNNNQIDASTALFFAEFKDEIKSLRTLWPGNDYCQYDGVTCDENGDVHINLRGRGLYGEMPEVKKSWGPSVRVVSIDLSDNVGLNDDLEEDWKYLTQLRVLNLSYTSFDDDIPDDWDEMSGLEELYLHNTAVCKSLPKWNGSKMPNLRILNLSNNNMYGSLRSEWGSFANLQTVDLSGNNFCGCVPSSWSSNSVLTNAVSGMSVTSATCSLDRCRNKGNCPKTPNFGGQSGGNNGGNNNNGGNTAVNDVYTKLFFDEFKDEIRSLRALWTGSDYCQYDGVTCDENGDVYINLRSRGLTGKMPEVDDDWGRYVRVVSIDLSDNIGLYGDIEDDWEDLTNLRFLNLSHTSLRGEIPDDWKKMSGLEELYLHNTAVCKSLPKWPGYMMPNLRVVDLSNNNMYGSLRSEWGSFTNLQSLNLAGNNFCGCVPSSWRSSVALLNAVSGLPVESDNCLTNNLCTKKSTCPYTPNKGTVSTAAPSEVPTTVAPTKTPTTSTTSTTTTRAPVLTDDTSRFLNLLRGSVSGLADLWNAPDTDYCGWTGVSCPNSNEVVVSLSGRGLSGVLPPVYDSILDGAQVKITNLDLSNNSIAGYFPDSWASLKQIRVLNLSKNPIGGCIPSSWNGMIRLEEVNLSETGARGSMPYWVLPNLRVVDLSNNGLTGALTAQWGLMTTLTDVNLAGNNFCGCMPDTWKTHDVLIAATKEVNSENPSRYTSLLCFWQYRCRSADLQCS
ncbi:Leucine rich repeat N-terminal domain containing protein, putative [Angomonas deanei]|uniref:Leucine rich repeat N-terminal domain containing protein, putative n=1 Tax=Angomonas deanei TaxID=59799 RepID=A0A7G2CIF5_9TRYP|nr:Leucine rich repeat N-terminal domain containing protein, putative [Angomonas deanei]